MTKIILLFFFNEGFPKTKSISVSSVLKLSQFHKQIIFTHIFRYKREIGNCLTAARNLRAEEARMDREAYEKAEQAERLEREARALDEEAAKLEREARQGGW